MVSELLLVRHPPVTLAWQKRCYGQSDPGLSRKGNAIADILVDQLVQLKPDLVLHSDMARTRVLALRVAHRLGLDAIADPLWRERHFGDWEGKSWHQIYRETGNAMDGMIDAPDTFRPGTNGETTCEMVARIGAALASIPLAGRVLIISHGGPIAAARLTVSNEPIARLQRLISAPGALVSLTQE